MSFVRYGSYQHQENECEVLIDKSAVLSSAGIPIAHDVRWTINGCLFGDDPSDLTTKIRALEDAYSIPGQSLGLYIDGTITAHSIPANSSDAGCQVIAGPSYPEGNGAEYSTFRKYQIVIGATVPVEAGKTDNILSFRESLQFSGTGGPLYTFLRTLNGPWQKQMVSQTSTVTCVQSGSAIGYMYYPMAPGPIFPGDEHGDKRQTTRSSPQRMGLNGQSYRNFETSWQYVFESVSRLSANPHTWTL